jgi:diguanylate cyclase (GGDEF)-like protein/PAS domain S-box-containing protein
MESNGAENESEALTRPRVPLRDPALLVILPALALLAVAHRYGAIAAEPLWAVLAGPVVTAGAAVALETYFPLGTTRARPRLFLGVATALLGVMLYLTGWGAIFAIALLTVPGFAIRASGSRCGAAAMIAIAATILGGEVGVALGVFKTMVPESTAHGVAVIEALLAVVVISIIIRGQRDKEEAEAREKEGEERFRALVQHASDAILVIEDGGRVRYASPAVEHVLGCAPDELGSFDLSWIDFDHVETLTEVWRRLRAHPGMTESLEVSVRRVDGTSRWVEVRLTNLQESPAVRGFVCNMRDIGERRLEQLQLIHDARHDPLTHLPNRRFFLERLVEVWHAATPEDLVALFFIDVDHFKEINDQYGHSIGDQALVAVANKLSTLTRPNDFVARLGGDEFVVLLSGPSTPESVSETAERVTHECARTWPIDDRSLELSLSIGVSTSFGKAKSVEEILECADRAMYEAKRNARARWEPTLATP